MRTGSAESFWYATYPDQELHGLVPDQWKEMGWQGRDPSTDFKFHFPPFLCCSAANFFLVSSFSFWHFLIWLLWMIC
ncbi:putative ELMO domain-containing protein [Rosa chinensis]|uniref:Putative ELMO domain-containing protein n=1 Tax=Rosa chinensis TaxID=74649 RepID=A0A2P6QFJ2_ROSCH|nr:putative ELMO domain-containing protein [Rosa chinensis]